MVKIGSKFMVKKNDNRMHPFYLYVQFDGTWHSIPDEQPHIRGIDPFVGGLPFDIKVPPVKINTGDGQRTFNGISRDKTLLTAAVFFAKWLMGYGSAKDKRILASFEVSGGKVVDIRYK